MTDNGTGWCCEAFAVLMFILVMNLVKLGFIVLKHRIIFYEMGMLVVWKVGLEMQPCTTNSSPHLVAEQTLPLGSSVTGKL
jgi:hypothetical protein